MLGLTWMSRLRLVTVTTWLESMRLAAWWMPWTGNHKRQYNTHTSCCLQLANARRVMPFGWHRFLDRAGRQCYKWRIATVIKVDKNQRKLKVCLSSLHTVPLDKQQAQD